MPCRLNGDVHEWFNEVVAVHVGSLGHSFEPVFLAFQNTVRQAHPAWKSGVECEGKSLSDCILNSKEYRLERVA